MGQEVVCQVERIVEDLETVANPPGTIAPAIVSEEIAKAFRVRPDEVAILVLVGAAKHLQFLIPEKLKPVGTIPLTSETALAARTARAKRPELINNFNITPHASIFETVPLGRHPGEHIHRIMSAPISAEGKVLGVVQIPSLAVFRTAKIPRTITLLVDWKPRSFSQQNQQLDLAGGCNAINPRDFVVRGSCSIPTAPATDWPTFLSS